MLLIAALSLLIPELDLLGDKEKGGARADAEGARAKAEVPARPVRIIDEIAKNNPDVDLSEFDREMNQKELGRMSSDRNFKRRSATKKLNTLKEALKNKANSEKFRTQREQGLFEMLGVRITKHGWGDCLSGFDGIFLPM